MFNSLLNFHEAKSLGLVTRYVLYCWISGASAAPIFTAVLLCRKWQCSASCSCTHHLSPNIVPQTAVSTTRTLTCRCRPRPASCAVALAPLRCVAVTGPQRIACSAKLNESGGMGFHEFASSCRALFAGRLCAAKPDAFTAVRQPRAHLCCVRMQLCT